MYYPKSQIKPNQYTNGGEFISTLDKKEYIGTYYQVSNGKFYAGEYKPNNQIELIKLDSTTNIQSEKAYWVNTPTNYQSLPEQEIPQNIGLKVDLEDYKIGYILRYYLKQVNKNNIIEVDIETYQKYVTFDKSSLSHMYIPFQVKWKLVGDTQSIYYINKAQIEKLERENKLLRGIQNYFKDKYTEFSQ